MTTEKSREVRIRRQLAKQGEAILRKIRTDSRWYHQYGPYMIVDDSNFVIHKGLDLDQAEAIAAAAKADRS